MHQSYQPIRFCSDTIPQAEYQFFYDSITDGDLCVPNVCALDRVNDLGMTMGVVRRGHRPHLGNSWRRTFTRATRWRNLRLLSLLLGIWLRPLCRGSCSKQLSAPLKEYGKIAQQNCLQVLCA